MPQTAWKVAHLHCRRETFCLAVWNVCVCMQDNARAALVEAISQRQKLMGKVTEASKRNSTRAFPDEMICKHAQAVTKLMQEQDQALDTVPNIAKTQLKSATHQHTYACPYKVDYNTGSPS